MRKNYAKKLVTGVLIASLTMTATMPLFADELATEVPSAGAAVIIENYINNKGSEAEIEQLLQTTAAANNQTNIKTETKAETTSTTATPAKKESSEDKLFENIAITKVSGGAEDYVNVRKKPSTDAKIVGKIYNNSGAKILEKTESGWYKIVSGNCSGYIKSDFFVTGSSAKSRALDNGYVQAVAKDAIHVRKETNTKSKIVTNVYKNETYTVKKFDKTGEWIKIKIKAGVSGWISAQYADITINMETAVTLKEEKEALRKQREAEQAAAEEAARQQAEEEANNQNNTYTNNNNTNTNNNSSKPSTSYGDDSSGSGTGSAIVSYAKRFLGNPYVYGGASLTNGTDCSGFTMSVYAHFGYGLSRSSYTQVNNGRSVSMSSLKPGDLLFYKYGGSTISHVAIYIGGGQIIHASTEKTGIIISGMGSPCAARRIVG